MQYIKQYKYVTTVTSMKHKYKPRKPSFASDYSDTLEYLIRSEERKQHNLICTKRHLYNGWWVCDCIKEKLVLTPQLHRQFDDVIFNNGGPVAKYLMQKYPERYPPKAVAVEYTPPPIDLISYLRIINAYGPGLGIPGITD